MAKFDLNLVEDIDRLFREKTIEEIMEVERLLDAEIEHKRVELRSMVGDRYRDVLTASDAIKSMKSLSDRIVSDIEDVTEKCRIVADLSSGEDFREPFVDVKQDTDNYSVAVQICLSITLNEQIWFAIDQEEHVKAAQLYLLAQHVHTGLKLLKDDIVENFPILKRIKGNLEMLRNRILDRIYAKLEVVELNSSDACSNLTALMLLQNETSLDLLKIFTEARSTSLSKITKISHSSVRLQVAAMVRCLMNTVHLSHDCFIYHGNTSRGLIWQSLEMITGEKAPKTLATVPLRNPSFLDYLPDVIKNFKPKCINTDDSLKIEDVQSVIRDWLKCTEESIRKALDTSLELVTNVKGLHIIREESLKIDLPPGWIEICEKTNLPTTFNVWYHFFQNSITDRALFLITNKYTAIVNELKKEIKESIDDSVRNWKDNDLLTYSWSEESTDVSRLENEHSGLSMKTKGYAPLVIKLCRHMDNKHLEFLKDTSFYFYGREFDSDEFKTNPKQKEEKKFTDRDKLERHLRSECVKNTRSLTLFIEDYLFRDSDRDGELYERKVAKCLICARFLQALTELCPHYRMCCSNNKGDEWKLICDEFVKKSLEFWKIWVEDCTLKTSEASLVLSKINPFEMLTILPKWESIEIQEEAEEKIFKSRIKIPSHPSLVLQEILNGLCGRINAVLPHTIPKKVLLHLIDKNVQVLLDRYDALSNNNLNQTQALQFLFDVKFLTQLCIRKENMELLQRSQEISDKFRLKIDPFDLDVFHRYLQNNVKQSVLQSQVILGCLVPFSGQLANLGVVEKNKEHGRDPSVLVVSVPSFSSYFMLLPVSSPSQKAVTVPLISKETKSSPTPTAAKAKKSTRSGAASLFGAMANDWFS